MERAETMAMRKLLLKYNTVIIALRDKDGQELALLGGRKAEDVDLFLLLEMVSFLVCRCKHLVFIPDDKYFWSSMGKALGISSSGTGAATPASKEKLSGVTHEDDDKYAVSFPNSSVYGEKVSKELLDEGYRAVLFVCKDAKTQNHACFNTSAEQASDVFSLLSMLCKIVRLSMKRAKDQGIEAVPVWETIQELVRVIDERDK